MKKDSSRLLFDKYSVISNKHIEVCLKDGRKIQGIIFGYYLLNPDNEDSPILTWHFTDDFNNSQTDFYCLGFSRGELIRHHDIVSVTFQEDNSIMTFFHRPLPWFKRE